MANLSPVQVRVRVFSARKVPEKWFERELFVTMELGKDRFKTAHLHGEANPKWNEECFFDLAPGTDLSKCELVLAIVAKETFKNEVVASNVITGQQLVTGLPQAWYPMLKKSKQTGIELSYEVTPLGTFPKSPVDAPAPTTTTTPTVAVTPPVPSPSPGPSSSQESGHKSSNFIGSALKPFSRSNQLSSESEFVLVSSPSLPNPPQTPSTSATQRPEITGLSPNSGPETGDTQVTIRGDNLGEARDDVIELSICGVDCLSSLVWMTPHKIICTTRAGIGLGEGPVVVATRSGGRAVSTIKFTYLPTTVDVESPHDDKDRHSSKDHKSKDERDLQILALQTQVQTLKTKLKEKEQDTAVLREYIDLLLMRILERQPSLLEGLSR